MGCGVGDEVGSSVGCGVGDAVGLALGLLVGLRVCEGTTMDGGTGDGVVAIDGLDVAPADGEAVKRTKFGYLDLNSS